MDHQFHFPFSTILLHFFLYMNLFFLIQFYVSCTFIHHKKEKKKKVSYTFLRLYVQGIWNTRLIRICFLCFRKLKAVHAKITCREINNKKVSLIFLRLFQWTPPKLSTATTMTPLPTASKTSSSCATETASTTSIPSGFPRPPDPGTLLWSMRARNGHSPRVGSSEPNWASRSTGCSSPHSSAASRQPPRWSPVSVLLTTIPTP